MNIKRNHTLGLEEARKRIDGMADSLASKYGLHSSWDGDNLRITGSGVDGKITVAASSVDVKLKLGFALKIMENTVRTSIEDAMDRHLV
ncbi:MAG: polyhydroxyalkanoic acid system family protein [Woeseiaceae bacterium]|nr:polyhydroxyalkanoic acid system family protein [Woeseiaceae bacterium]